MLGSFFCLLLNYRERVGAAGLDGGEFCWDGEGAFYTEWGNKPLGDRPERALKRPEPLQLPALAPYEDMLLHALAFFRTNRSTETQAHHCLSMYLRQGEARVMGEVGFYARLLGMEPFELLQLIYQNPEMAIARLSEYGEIAPVAED